MQIILDGKSVFAESGETIFDVAQREGIEIPTLCRLPDLKPFATSCLVCLVKINDRFVPSCATYVEEGMNVESESEEVRTMRRSALELLLSDHIDHCQTCGEGRKKCRLLKYMAKYKADRHRFSRSVASEPQVLESEPFVQNERVVFDPRKCIKCGLCIATTRRCGEEIGLTFLGRGFETRVGIPFDESLQRGIERSADEIIAICPTAALTCRED